MSALWTAAELSAATGGKVAPSVSVTGISIDSRSLQPGDLFVALKVERDGHDFVAKAIEKGAAAALVSRDVEGVDSKRLIKVSDPLLALEALGRARRAQVSARIAAVTGSVGKTSTKEALRHLLGLQGRTHASAASYNNLWGVPLSLARMPSDTQLGVFEIGMNHAGEITPLTAQVRPHVAIVTMVAPVHLEHFNSVADIADAKGEIFSGLEPGGTAVINGDLEWTERLRKRASDAGAKMVTFGRGADCDVKLESLQLSEDHSEIGVRFFGEQIHYRLSAPGQHWAMNSLGVLAVIKALGGDPIRAARDMAGIVALSGRGAREHVTGPYGRFELIDESYNANPASMASAIAVLGQVKPEGGRRIAVLGDMLELGPTGPELHAGLNAALRQAGIDRVYAAGPLMRNLWDALAPQMRGVYGASSRDIAETVAADLRAGDVVMIKGSYGSKMVVVVEALRRLEQQKG
ncbi:MAG: UDP-N-acetylmuramoylalanyl-D-glutamyl-2,6-diaminopimelate--D-alanyl-D-alanine ligase [Alphaproteobacteria bacterium]|nr:UDP-N-acetylmuramoylalanyl-D-glutamyl-2,6-diaminopimelate--D-alanyl-D-alanine ligase [Alphaproteobacteria bacterium]